MEKVIATLCVALCFCGYGRAQRVNDAEDFEAFRKSIRKDFNDFRKKCNEEYAAFLKNPWAEFREETPVPRPKEDDQPPVVCPEDDDKSAPAPVPLPYSDVVPAPTPQPQPDPVRPIKDRTDPAMQSEVDFILFGTPMKVHYDKTVELSLNGVGENDMADAWTRLSGESTTALLADCLRLRRENGLCDWAYLKLLEIAAATICGKGTNEATMLMAFAYCQSGYKMRLARDNANRLYMLYASQHDIYDVPYYVVGGDKYYPFNGKPSTLFISNAAYPREQSLSLLLTAAPQFAMSVSETRVRQSARYPDVKVTYSSNKNLMDFYTTYPTSAIGGNMVSRWAIYANTPMNKQIKQQIYPDLRKAIEGCDQLTAVNKLLNFVQTGFTYEYDDKVWGGDRAFFAEESLYYPYCDCEDRSILFTRLVRDLLGLRCILIYYPGHLASAVELTSGAVNGDYILLDNRKFIIADATYIGAPVGKTMPEMDNRTAKVILLD